MDCKNVYHLSSWRAAVLIAALALLSGKVLPAQIPLIQVEGGTGFSAVRISSDGSGGYFVQGTMPSYLGWPDQRIDGRANEDVFFMRLEPSGRPVWHRIFGGDGVESIVSAPVREPSGSGWVFFGEAVDSLVLDRFQYRPTRNSFFQFAGKISGEGELEAMVPMESDRPLLLTAANWSPDGASLYLAGIAETAVFSGKDTLVYGITGRYGFVLIMDQDLVTRDVLLIPGDVQPFDLVTTSDRLILGMNIRDQVMLDSVTVQARVQDRDCLVTTWDIKSHRLNWYRKLGGVYEKTGVRLLADPGIGEVHVLGHFIGTISDEQFNDFESRGFEPDLFHWIFRSDGGVQWAGASGGPGPEWLADALLDDERIRLLVRFTGTMEVYGFNYQTPISGVHAALLELDRKIEPQAVEYWLGNPELIGYDLVVADGYPGFWGGFSGEVLDEEGNSALSIMGQGNFDYVFRLPRAPVSTRRSESNSGWLLAPNPAIDQVWIIATGGATNAVPTHEFGWLFDANGKAIRRISNSPFYIGDLHRGLYYLMGPSGVLPFVKY